MKKILIVNSNYYFNISKNLILGAKKKLKKKNLKLYILLKFREYLKYQ